MKKFLVALLFVLLTGVAHAAEAGTSTLYELRIYVASAGRLPDLEALMASHGVKLLAKHGIRNVFDGTVLEPAPVDGADAGNMLVCILAHSDRATADKAWAAFDGDTEWKSALRGADKNGPLLAKPASSLYLEPTDFSPMLEAPSAAGSPNRVFELRKYNTGPDRLPNMVAEFREGLAAILTNVGMKPIVYTTAADRSSYVYLLAHKDRDAARASWAAFVPQFRPFIADFNAKAAAARVAEGKPPAPPSPRAPEDNRFLIPTGFSPIH